MIVIRCGRCGSPVQEEPDFFVDIDGKAICRPCHEAEWALDEEAE